MTAALSSTDWRVILFCVAGLVAIGMWMMGRGT